jgi:microcystin-dependent protein
MATQPYLADIKMFGGNFAPRGWAFCNGQLLPISQNDALFALIGTTYGGDGQVTFALPDLRGRRPIHWGQGPGLSNYVQGEVAGTEAVTLLSTQMPSHNHPVSGGGVADFPLAAPCFTGPGTNISPEGRVFAVNKAGKENFTGVTGNTPLGSTAKVSISVAAPTVGIEGGSQPHENLAPLLAISFIIALEGIFPSRN